MNEALPSRNDAEFVKRLNDKHGKDREDKKSTEDRQVEKRAGLRRGVLGLWRLLHDVLPARLTGANASRLQEMFDTKQLRTLRGLISDADLNTLKLPVHERLPGFRVALATLKDQLGTRPKTGQLVERHLGAVAATGTVELHVQRHAVGVIDAAALDVERLLVKPYLESRTGLLQDAFEHLGAMAETQAKFLLSCVPTEVEKAIKEVDDACACARFAKYKPKGGGNLTEMDAFVVKHFAGEVIYHGSGFIDKNSNSLPPLLDSQLRVVQQILPSESDGAQQADAGGGAKRQTVAMTYVKDMEQLHSDLTIGEREGREQDGEQSSRHYIRCIKSTPEQAKRTFDKMSVHDQLLNSGMLEALRLMQLGFPSRVKKTALSRLIRENAKAAPEGPIARLLERWGLADVADEESGARAQAKDQLVSSILHALQLSTLTQGQPLTLTRTHASVPDESTRAARPVTSMRHSSRHGSCQRVGRFGLARVASCMHPRSQKASRSLCGSG